MELWQCEHITKNLPQLLRLTDFSSLVKAYFQQYNILTHEEVEELNAIRNTKGKTNETYHGYTILQSRSNAYEVLIKALEETRQSGALKILRIGGTNQDIEQELVAQIPSLPSNTVAVTTPPENSILDGSTSAVAISSPNIAISSAPDHQSVEGRMISTSLAYNQPPPDSQISLPTTLPVEPQPSTSQNSSAGSAPSSNLSSTPLTLPTTEQIKYSESDKLGTGSGGTIVCKGTFGKRDVAVKILSDFKDKSEAENEIEKLLKCDNHENIVRYYHSEKTPNGFRIALELCEKYTLEDWVENPSCLQVDIDPLDVLRQTTQGLGFLHRSNINIIHRDLKPSNILFSIRGNEAIVKISDFGISRTINPGQTKKTVTSIGGTFGWIAPEMLEANSARRKSRSRRGKVKTTEPKMTTKIDIFSLGCIYYFLLTKGEHPFGDDENSKNLHILNGNTQFLDQHDSLHLQCNLELVKNMIARDPETRPDVKSILAHPMFWDYTKMIDFIDAVSNFVTKPSPSNKELCDKCVAKLETNYFPKISNGSKDGWFDLLDDKLKKIFMERFNVADKHKAIELIRKIRNARHHYDEPNYVEIKETIGELPDAFMISWLKMFPTLINEMRDAFDDLKAREAFNRYFS